MITTLNGNSNPQPTFGVLGKTIPIFTPSAMRAVVTTPTQIAGLVPLDCITQDARLPAFAKCDCREWTNDNCYINPVFALSSADTDPLKNDHSFFLEELPFFFPYQWAQGNAAYSLQEWDGANWITTTALNNNNYGTFYNFNSLCIENWIGFDVDWKKVLIAFGEGLYRIRFDFTIFGISGVRGTPPFCLKEWSCKGTDVTVRWETSMTGGRLGSIVDDQRTFDFCCITVDSPGHPQKITSITWNDQLRVYAFFGREKTEYERVNVEYANGEIVQVRNEAIQKFEYESALQPKWVHDRLKAYAFMADELYVTDYNWNNSDYEIDKKRVTCDGSYEPEYHKDTRHSFVKVQFKEGFQNVIREKCCNAKITRTKAS